MKYEYINDGIKLSKIDSFNIMQTLECGQCFRFYKISDFKYIVIAFNKVLNIIQTNEQECFFYPLTMKEFEDTWAEYFDLFRDYGKIKHLLSFDDEILKMAVEFAPGIRILKQDIFECLISFIISQNNRIPMIKQAIRNISEMYGQLINNGGTNENDEPFYTFPGVLDLANAETEHLRQCKTGFRDKYINDAAVKVHNNIVPIEEFKKMDTSEIKNSLLNIKGVGEKVSDCVILFSCSRYEVFPTDVWVKRVMEHFYFNDENVSIKEIHNFAKKKFGEYAGFAQQYLFHYARQLKIGRKK